MFHNAHSNTFHNSTFVHNVKEAPSLEILHRRVAPNAILNAGGRADKVGCHPGTRTEVIDRVEKWADALDVQTAPIFWLSGPAGAGKSAIMQTVAERCDQRGVPHANFFFFRGDPSRCNAHPLVPTLLHQIILDNSSLREETSTMLSNNPLVFSSSLEDQLTLLITMLLHANKHSTSTYRPLILLIDGLDECDSETKATQQRILIEFDKLFAQNPRACLFRLLVASRDEPQIKMAFTMVSSDRINLYLDDSYSPANDIRIFVEDQFCQVKKSHGRLYTLDASWPSVNDVDYIVEKSSGQFIYASTIMGFISGSSADPTLSLDRVKGAEKFATHSPFPHLDSIYTYILSQVDDQTTLKDVLRAHTLLTKMQQSKPKVTSVWTDFAGKEGLVDALEAFNMPCKDSIVRSCLEDLTSLAKYTDGKLLYHHASFSDYLLDQSRSGRYFVDVPRLSSTIALQFWKTGQYQEFYREQFGMLLFMCMTSLPPGLTTLVLDDRDSLRGFHLMVNYCRILERISDLCVSHDDVAVFREFMHRAVYASDYGRAYVYQQIAKSTRFLCRYYQMARAENAYEPDDEMTAAFRPEFDADRRELASWLKCLLYRLKGGLLRYHYCPNSRLVDIWTSWIVSHDAFLDITYLEIAPTESEFDHWRVKYR